VGQTLDQLFDDRLARTHNAAADSSAARLAAFALAPPHPLIGFFSLNNIVRGIFQSTDASWIVSADSINQGFATEGVAALLDIAFHTLGLHRVQANSIPTNLASLRVARKVGFREEGRALRMLKIADQWQDHLMFAKLADEHPT